MGATCNHRELHIWLIQWPKTKYHLNATLLGKKGSTLYSAPLCNQLHEIVNWQNWDRRAQLNFVSTEKTSIGRVSNLSEPQCESRRIYNYGPICGSWKICKPRRMVRKLHKILNKLLLHNDE